MASSDSTRDMLNGSAGLALPSPRVFCWLAAWLFAACSDSQSQEPWKPASEEPPAAPSEDAGLAKRDDAAATRPGGGTSGSGGSGARIGGTGGAADGGAQGEAGTAGSTPDSDAGAAGSPDPVDEMESVETETDPVAKRQCFGLDLPERALAPVVSDLSALEPYFPTNGFRTAKPAAAGLDEAKLNEALMFSTPHSSTDAILVMRKGYIVAERYFGTTTADTRIESFSIAKGFVSALVGIAIGAGKIPSVDERLCTYYPEWDCDDASDPRSRITLRHVMTLQTGLEWSEDWTPDGLAMNDTVWGVLNLLDYVLAKPAVMEPGLEMRYSTGAPALLSGVIQKATGKTALEYAQEVLFAPIGIPNVMWSADLKGRTTTWAGVQATVREYAKFGFLYSKHGQWEGREVVPPSWVDLTTQRVRECEDRYGFLWHLNMPIRFGMADATTCTSETFLSCKPLSIANLPGDGFFAQGVAGQFIFIFPSTDLVVVRMASDEFSGQYWDEYAREMLARLFDAIIE